MKKKLLVAALAVIMVVTAIAGTSLAYLNDSDYDKNTMTVGNVKIVQNEKDRDGNAYTDGQKLLPAVYNGELSYDGKSYLDGPIWDKSVENEIDKFVTVTNTGTEAAYIRTIFAFEDKKLENGKYQYLTEQIHTLWNVDGAVNSTEGVDWPMEGAEYLWITVGDTNYTVCVYTYAAPVESKATTDASLCQLFLDPTSDNSFYDTIGEQYDILVLSQAVQAQGFADATTALNAAFGEVSVANKANVQKWFVDANSSN